MRVRVRVRVSVRVRVRVRVRMRELGSARPRGGRHQEGVLTSGRVSEGC